MSEELGEMLQTCVMEGEMVADTKSGAEADLFRESYEILNAILEESQA